MKSGFLFSRRTVIAFLLLLSCPAVLTGGEGESVELAPREWGKYRTRLPDQDTVRWEARWDLERISPGPPARYRVTDTVRGNFGEDSLPQVRITEAEFLLRNGRLQMLESLLTVSDRAGKVLYTLQKKFDYRQRSVRTRKEYPAGETERDEFDMGSRLVDAKEIVSTLRGFPFPPPAAVRRGEYEDPELEFEFLNESPDTYSILVTYEGIEDVSVPAGDFSCHKLRIVPDLGILTFVGKIFAPDLYMWFTVAPPHFWVKYRGLEGDLSTPSVVSELVEFNRSSQ